MFYLDDTLINKDTVQINVVKVNSKNQNKFEGNNFFIKNMIFLVNFIYMNFFELKVR